MTCHQYGISALLPQTSSCRETSGGVSKCQLFCQAKNNSVNIFLSEEMFFIIKDTTVYFLNLSFSLSLYLLADMKQLTAFKLISQNRPGALLYLPEFISSGLSKPTKNIMFFNIILRVFVHSPVLYDNRIEKQIRVNVHYKTFWFQTV